MKHHFDTLGLREGASQEQIQEAYQRLSKELNPASNDNQDFFVEEYKKMQQAYKTLNQSSILKNSDSSSGTVRSNRDATPAGASSSAPSGSFTVTISPEKIEELKNKAQEANDKPHVKPSMFRNPFSFNGRIRRLEYGISFIIYYVWILISAVLAVEIDAYDYEGIYYLLLSPGFFFFIAQGAKRCHDRGNSGGYQIIPFYAFWMLFADGDIGSNEYGENPKGINKIN